MPAIPIPEYCPDIAVVNGSFTDNVVNMFPASQSYIPVNDLASISPSVPGKVIGAIALRFEKAIRIIAGTEKKIYVYDAPNKKWLDISRDGAPYNAIKWSFAVFGLYVIAVNESDNAQIFDLKNETKFRDMRGNPPRAGLVRVWGDFVCLMQLRDNPRRIHWSGLSDPEHWTVNQNSCDIQEFPDGEYVQGSTESTNPIIFLRTAIYSAAFTPSSKYVFSFTKIQQNVGAKGPGGIACRGSDTFFVDDSGFYRMGPQNQLMPIGFQKINRTVFATYGNDALENVRSVIDPIYDRVYWTLELSAYSQVTFVYDWGLNKWSTIQSSVQYYLPIFSVGYTLDNLDTFSLNVDSIEVSLDNPLWYNGTPCLGAFDDQDRLGFFSGGTMEATISSPEFGAPSGDVVFFNRVFAEIDTDEALLSVGSRFNRTPADHILWGDEREYFNRINGFNVRCKSRYHTLKLRVPAGVVWRNFTGFYVDYKSAGKW